MAKSSLMGSALSAAFIASLGFATPAQALDPKQCLSMAEMNAALKAEGQRTMIIGEREFIYSPTGKIEDASIPGHVNTVTSNADGSLGYQLEGDGPISGVSKEVCVRAKLTNIRMLDARRPGLPREVLLGGKWDEALRGTEKLGTRPMVIADSVHANPDGSLRKGLPVVVLGNIPHKVGFLITRKADGTPVEMGQMRNTEYTAAGLARLNQQVAMLTP